jgi:hypothetical protein
MIDRKVFFDHIRKMPFPGNISAAQVGGCNVILDEAEKRKFDPRWTAYCLATAFHETAHTMLPIAEYGRGKGKAYGEPINGKVYYGRGYVQLTWIKNYETIGKLLKVDLVGNPELALDARLATGIMFEGMIRGSFTGKRLSDFFNDAKTDWSNARKIINGLDRASMIAGYARQFHGALIAANAPVAQPIPDAPAPKPKPATPKSGNVAGAGAVIVATGAGTVIANETSKKGASAYDIGLVVFLTLVIALAGFFTVRHLFKRN